jgi:hypothetical protein
MIVWLNPAALAGLVLLAGPVLVHLLLRHRAVRVPFPSLRFVRPSRTSAVRVRLLSDLALLLLRLAIVALAVAALAQPLLLVRPRLAAWDARMARAIVVDVSDSTRTRGEALSEAADAVEAEGRGAVFAARIDAAELRPGVLQAIRRLASAPPARREIVVISDFQRGALTREDLGAVPPSIGIRLVQVGAVMHERRVRGIELFHPSAQRTRAGDPGFHPSAQRTRAGDPGFHPSAQRTRAGDPGFGTGRSLAQEVVLAGTATTVSVVPGSAPREGLRLMAADADAVALRALERTVASAGAPAPSPNQPIAIVFAGGPAGQAVREISESWMLETVLRMRNDRDLTAACGGAGPGTPGGESPTRDLQTSDRTGTGWHVLCRDRQSRPVVRAAAAGPQLVLDVDAPPSALLAAAAVRAALTARHGSGARPEEEIQRMMAAELLAWSRPSPPVAAETWRSGQKPDSRWCWALVLVLLAVEAAVRRRKTAGRKTAGQMTGGRRTDAPHEAHAGAA